METITQLDVLRQRLGIWRRRGETVALVPTMGHLHRAVFGEKDWQQLLVIRALAADLSFPVTVASLATQREADGLAMSSRNAYLSAEERRRAPALHRALTARAKAVAAHPHRHAAIAASLRADLAAAGFRVDYAEVRRAEDLAPPAVADNPEDLRLFAAAFLGSTRLINNVAVGEPPFEITP